MITLTQPRHITGTNSGKRSRDYYFFPTVNEEEAFEAAHSFKTCYAQCWDSWTMEKRVPKPGLTHVHGQAFKAPSPGIIMCFEHGSAS